MVQIDLAIAFALISAWYHYVTVRYRDQTVSIGEKEVELYEASLTYRYNPLRWHDYSCSAAVMLACVASLCGVEDWTTLLLGSTLLFILLTFTLPLERDLAQNSLSKTGPLSYRSLVGTFTVLCLSYVIMWLPTIFAFASAWETDPQPPDVIYTILVSIITLYTAFAVCFGLVAVIRIGPNTASEEGFICLSFLSKTILHWLLFTGIRGRTDRVYTSFDDISLPSNFSDISPFKENEGGMNTDDQAGIIASTVGTTAIAICFYLWTHYYVFNKQNDTTENKMLVSSENM